MMQSPQVVTNQPGFQRTESLGSVLAFEGVTSGRNGREAVYMD
ncbi:hypothetical protein [Parendozoicomonas sp. Alg238-R29]|nr:hypothetical protein [Parendozoicomonas sp. Alg238-R29]